MGDQVTRSAMRKHGSEEPHQHWQKKFQSYLWVPDLFKMWFTLEKIILYLFLVRNLGNRIWNGSPPPLKSADRNFLFFSPGTKVYTHPCVCHVVCDVFVSTVFSSQTPAQVSCLFSWRNPRISGPTYCLTFCSSLVRALVLFLACLIQSQLSTTFCAVLFWSKGFSDNTKSVLINNCIDHFHISLCFLLFSDLQRQIKIFYSYKFTTS